MCHRRTYKESVLSADVGPPETNMRPGATKGTLRRENKHLFFDVLCLITFHWSFKKN